MKKVILILVVILCFSSTVFAEELVISPTPIQLPAESSTPATVNYTLPYPGLLPGNPLYLIKIMRDKLVEFLITDPLKKSEFYLLQADKHLNAGIFLSQQGKSKNSEEIISKGENYLEMSLSKAMKAKEQSEPIQDVIGKIKLSTLKHQEVIKELILTAPKDVKPGLENNLKRAQDFEKSVSQYSPQIK